MKNDFNFVELEKRNSASIKKLETENLYNLENYAYNDQRKYSAQNRTKKKNTHHKEILIKKNFNYF